MLFTIGYEGSDIGRFVSALTREGVKVLVDGRAVSLSRKPGFSKPALASRLEREGIRYLHYRDLKTPEAGRSAARAGPFELFQRIYAIT